MKFRLWFGLFFVMLGLKIMGVSSKSKKDDKEFKERMFRKMTEGSVN